MKTKAKTEVRFICGNSATIDGDAPGPDSPCLTERRTGEAAVLVVEGSPAEIRIAVKEARWKQSKQVYYCGPCMGRTR